jgi:hypothetical protein
LLIPVILSALFSSGGAIVYQDFKDRRISIWVICVFFITNSIYVICKTGLHQLVEQAVFGIFYLLICYSVIHLYFFLKSGRFSRLFDDKLGWGDVMIAFIVGCGLPALHLIYFFTASLIFALLFVVVVHRNKSIPLAGILVPCYFVYLLLFIEFAIPTV